MESSRYEKLFQCYSGYFGSLSAGWCAVCGGCWVGSGPKIRPDLLPLYFVTVACFSGWPKYGVKSVE